MATENNISPDELLDNIKRVDAPPFMLTRIQAKIDVLQTEVVKPVFAWSLAGVVIIVLLVNLMAYKQYQKSDNSGNLVELMDLAPQNDIYIQSNP